MIRALVVAAALVAATRAARADWRGRDFDRQVPRWLVPDSGEANTFAPGALADPAIAERAARAILEAQLATVAPGATPADLRVVANVVTDGKRTVGFQQTWRGLDVEGGQVAVVFARDRAIAISSRARPHVTLAPTVALAAPRARVAIPPGYTLGAARDRVVIADRAGAYHLADPIDVVGPHARWTLYVGLDGAVLASRDRLLHDATVRFDVGARWPGGARLAAPAPALALTVDGAPATTADDGTVAFAGASAQLVPSLTGPRVAIAPAVTLAPPTLAVAAGGDAVWSAPTDQDVDAALTTFVHVSLGKQRARRIVPAIASWLDTPLAVGVDETDADCNAYFDGTSLHFFRATATCENTGRLADVVVHELGHAIHHEAVIVGQGVMDTDLSEGLADFHAANLHDDSQLGVGFDFTAAPIRDLAPLGRPLAHPDDLADDPHANGLIIGGALWDLRAAAIAQLGADAGVTVAETAFRGVLERAADIPSAYTAALIEDDDDADLANGTPHRCLIEAAFARHGLVPDAAIAVSPATLDGDVVSITVARPAGAACPPPAVTAATLHYRTDATRGDVALAPRADAPSTFAGTFPTIPAGTLVRYTVDVTFADGSTIRRPSTLADPDYQLYVGPVARLYCAPMDADPGWTHTDGWAFATLPATSAPNPPRAHTGAGAYGTGLANNGRYPDGAMLRATLPAIDTAGATRVHLQLWRWLTVEDAFYDQASIVANDAVVWQNPRAFGTLNLLDREWRFQDVDVTSAIGADHQLTVAFALASDSIGGYGGWTLDDVCVVALGPTCGDGVVDTDEACDDGNRADGDGCDATCQLEPVGTLPGGCCAIDDDGRGGLALAAAVAGVLTRRRARRGRARAPRR